MASKSSNNNHCIVMTNSNDLPVFYWLYSKMFSTKMYSSHSSTTHITPDVFGVNTSHPWWKGCFQCDFLLTFFWRNILTWLSHSVGLLWISGIPSIYFIRQLPLKKKKLVSPMLKKWYFRVATQNFPKLCQYHDLQHNSMTIFTFFCKWLTPHNYPQILLHCV